MKWKIHQKKLNVCNGLVGLFFFLLVFLRWIHSLVPPLFFFFHFESMYQTNSHKKSHDYNHMFAHHNIK